ncbi:MAG: Ppx/GppA phosphatase family protein [Marivibrio sp.]|uniref:Ppx/GppA phosphatase family protein n=1 Tax=Marivibrio sp. TaxID=2039719 RepID=UPI0032EBA130
MSAGGASPATGAGRAARRRPQMKAGGRGRRAEGAVYGALDLGTNNCRLLVATPTAGGFKVVDAFSRVVQLGEGVSRGGRLGEPAMRRTLDALGVCAAKLRRRGVSRMRAVATEACRRAANAERFVARVRRETGLTIEIIPPSEEARLAIAGCVPLLDRVHDRAILFDIGGGSTQIVWLAVDPTRRTAPEVLGATSIPVGVVGLAEARAAGVGAGESRLLAEGLAAFDATHALHRAVGAGRVQMIGASNTVTTLSSLDQKLASYQRAKVDGAWLDFAAIDRLSAELAALDGSARAAHPCVGRDRAGLVLAGCEIVGAICRRWPVGRLRVADRGLRDGILMDLIAADRNDRP